MRKNTRFSGNTLFQKVQSTFLGVSDAFSLKYFRTGGGDGHAYFQISINKQTCLDTVATAWETNVAVTSVLLLQHPDEENT